MKKLAIILAFIGATILCSSTTTNATTVRLYVNFSISNSCNPNWTGNYCVQLKLAYNNIPVTSTVSSCQVTFKGGCCYFDFDIAEVLAENLYGYQLIAATEQNGPCHQIYSGNFQGGFSSWNDLQSCSTAPTVVITL